MEGRRKRGTCECTIIFNVRVTDIAIHLSTEQTLMNIISKRTQKPYSKILSTTGLLEPNLQIFLGNI